MEYPLNIYITAHTLISSLGFGIPENLEAIHNYRSGIRMQEAGLISDHPLLAGMIDSVELEKRAKLMQITDYTRMEQLFILAIQEVISQSGADLREPDYALLLSTTKGNVDLLSELPADSPVFLENGGANRRFLWSDKSGRGHLQCLYIRSLGTNRR